MWVGRCGNNTNNEPGYPSKVELFVYICLYRPMVYTKTITSKLHSHALLSPPLLQLTVTHSAVSLTGLTGWLYIPYRPVCSNKRSADSHTHSERPRSPPSPPSAPVPTSHPQQSGTNLHSTIQQHQPNCVHLSNYFKAAPNAPPLPS